MVCTKGADGTICENFLTCYTVYLVGKFRGKCMNEMLVTLHVSTSTDNTSYYKTSSFICTQYMNDMLVTRDLSTSLRNCAGYFISACTKDMQETSLEHPLYVFCSGGNSSFCPVHSI
jgi:hypothetical protein